MNGRRFGMLAAASLCRRELTRFYRERSRVIGAIVPPFVFWFLLGSGLGSSFRIPGMEGGVNYLQYFFPGTVVLVVLFTAIFSTISIIEDRREGFLQSVLVAPIPRSSVVAGKIFGGALLAFFQGMLFLLMAPSIGLHVDAAGAALIAATLLLIALGLTGLGFVIAWTLDSTQGFHAIMNLFLIPMWMLSGALFPITGAPVWLRAVVAVNPLTYGIAALQTGLRGSGQATAGPPSAVCLGVIAAFCVVTFAAAVFVARRPERAGH